MNDWWLAVLGTENGSLATILGQQVNTKASVNTRTWAANGYLLLVVERNMF